MFVLFSTNTLYLLNISNTYPLAFKRLKMCLFEKCDKKSCSTMDYFKPTYLSLSLASYLPTCLIFQNGLLNCHVSPYLVFTMDMCQKLIHISLDGSNIINL